MNASPENFPHGMSANEYLATLPVRRRSAESRGLLLLTPRTGLVVVPHTKHPYGWDVTVVGNNTTYPRVRGGNSLYLGSLEIETAIELLSEEALQVMARESLTVEQLER